MFSSTYFETLLHGKERVNYLQKCIDEADKEKDIYNMLRLRHDCIKELVFYDDSFQAIIMFSEFMKLFDEHTNVITPSLFIWTFKWIIEESEKYYQISIEQIEAYFEKFKSYIKKFGYTMRTYYFKQYQVYENIDIEFALKAFTEFEKYERTEISDCIICENNAKARKEMLFGSKEKAVQMINDSKNIRCSDEPQVTFGCFVNKFAKIGLYEEAEHYAELMMPMIKGDEAYFMMEIAYVLELKVQTDLNDAYEIFCNYAEMFSRIKNPKYRFKFASAAYRFFSKLEEDGEKELQLKVSSDFEFFSASGKYDTIELRDKFYIIAKDLAIKFDNRNGTNYYNEELKFVYPNTSIKKIMLPVHGSVSPKSPEIGLIIHSPKDIYFDNHDELEQILAKKLGITEVSINSHEENNRILIYGKKLDGSKVQYLLRLYDIPNLDGLVRWYHWFPKGTLDNLHDYNKIVVITSMIQNTNRFKELQDLFKFIEVIDNSDSIAFYELVNMRLISKKWLALETKGSSFPLRSYYSDSWVYSSVFEKDKIDIATRGMSIFGSRDFFVPAVKKENEKITRKILDNLMDVVSVTALADENVTMNSDIIYDNKSFVRFTWKPLTLPDKKEKNQEIYAEPILYLTYDDQILKHGCKITDLSDDDIKKLSFRKQSVFAENEKLKCRERFPEVVKFFQSHDCNVIIGANYSYIEGEEKENLGWFYAELIDNGINGRVISTSSNIEEKLHKNDIVVIDPDKIFFERIDLDGGNDKYFVDEFYILFD